jgi:NAD(P)H-nitrite reductase large subunit
MHKKFVVIGSSAAGISAVTMLRELNKEAEVICISDELEMPYNKCLIADYVAGDKQLTDIFTRAQDFFETQNIQLILGKKVERINAKNHSVFLADGTKIGYDKLLIATGARYRKKFQDLQNDAIFHFYSLHDAIRLKKYCQERTISSAIIVGAGLTGVECANALAQIGISVSVLESRSHLLHDLIGEEAAQIVNENAKKVGVEFFFNEIVQEVRCQIEKVIVQTNRRNSFEAEMLIFASGSQQNIELVQEAEIDICDNGIIVNDDMQTSDEEIFAAGDCIATIDKVSGESCRSFKWSDAAAQGVCAAYSMIGIEKKYSGILRIHSSFFFGKKFFVVGKTNAAFDEEFKISTPDSYVMCKRKDSKIVLIQIIGYGKQVPILRQYYAQQQRITLAQLSELFVQDAREL